MSVSKKSILFFEDSLDLSHLKNSLEKYELNSTYSDSIDSFSEQTNRLKFDLLVISALGSNSTYLSLINSLNISKNSDTSVLLILDNNSIPDIDDLLKQQSDIITFPFMPDEFVYRVYQILRSVETEKTIDNNLKSYKSLLDNLAVGIIQTDAHGKFIRTNPRFLSMINMSEKDLFKENFFQLSHPDDYFLERKQLDRLLKKELDCTDFEIRLINNEGVTIVCSTSARILWADKDNFDSFTFVIQLVSA